jgi:hypothetical protein
MVGAYAKATSTHLQRGTTMSGIQESENIVLNLVYNPLFLFSFISSPASRKEKPIVFPLFFCVVCHACNSFIFFQEIDHRGALLHELILCLHI